MDTPSINFAALETGNMKLKVCHQNKIEQRLGTLPMYTAVRLGAWDLSKHALSEKYYYPKTRNPDGKSQEQGTNVQLGGQCYYPVCN